MLVSRVEKWFSYTHTHIYSIFVFLSIIGYYKILSIIAYTVTAGPCCLHILYMHMCVLSHFNRFSLWSYEL